MFMGWHQGWASAAQEIVGHRQSIRRADRARRAEQIPQSRAEPAEQSCQSPGTLIRGRESSVLWRHEHLGQMFYNGSIPCVAQWANIKVGIGIKESTKLRVDQIVVAMRFKSSLPAMYSN